MKYRAPREREVRSFSYTSRVTRLMNQVSSYARVVICLSKNLLCVDSDKHHSLTGSYQYCFTITLCLSKAKICSVGFTHIVMFARKFFFFKWIWWESMLIVLSLFFPHISSFPGCRTDDERSPVTWALLPLNLNANVIHFKVYPACKTCNVVALTRGMKGAYIVTHHKV